MSPACHQWCHHFIRYEEAACEAPVPHSVPHLIEQEYCINRTSDARHCWGVCRAANELCVLIKGAGLHAVWSPGVCSDAGYCSPMLLMTSCGPHPALLPVLERFCVVPFSSHFVGSRVLECVQCCGQQHCCHGRALPCSSPPGVLAASTACVLERPLGGCQPCGTAVLKGRLRPSGPHSVRP